MGLKNQFAISISSVVLIVIIGVAGMMALAEHHLLKNEIHRHQTELVERLAKVCEESLYQNEIVFLNYLKSLRNERGFVSAAFVNNTDQIQLHSDPQMIGTVYQERKRGQVDYKAPVLFGGSSVGAVHLIFSQDILNNFVLNSLLSTLKRVAIISLMALAIGLLGAYALAGQMVKPIYSVVNGMRAVAQGDLQPLPPPKRQDELGWMMEELNVMIHKLKELDDMKREFVASVTHEFRSPLTAIERFVSLLLKGHYGPINSEQRESLMTVQNNSVRLSHFVDNLLTVAKLETPRVDIFCESFDLRPVLAEAVHLYKPLALEKGLLFESLEGETPLPVWADKGKVNQILSNLISNAIKFTEKGAVKLKAVEKPAFIEITVEDTGIGIPVQDQDKIFGKFYRSPSISHKVKGTGLGLAIVKGFLEAQGGTIYFSNNANGGTSFIFTLPKPAT